MIPPIHSRLATLILSGGLCGVVGLQSAPAAATMVDFGSASGFGVLASTAITVTGNVLVRGDAGTASGTAISGPGVLTLTGTDHGGDAVTLAAHADLAAAWQAGIVQPADFNYAAVADLGSLTLGPGLHKGASSFAVTGNLTLDAGGDPDAVWIFHAFSTLTTGAGSSVILTNGAQAKNILWLVGSSATLGTGSALEGNLLALTSVTLTTGAAIHGGVYARNGAVTFDNNIVGIPEPGCAALVLTGLLGAGGLRKRRAAPGHGGACP